MLYNVIVYYIYVLQSFKDKGLYIGFSSDLRKRVDSHNKGRVLSTKDRVPFRLIYYEAYIDRLDATGREKFLKSGSGWRYIKKQLFHYLNVSS